MRPPTPRDVPPAGYRYEAFADSGWIAPPIGAGRCRYGARPGTPACGKPAAATLMRPPYSPGRQRPWDYCADHLYGRWIENGRVMSWRLVEVDA